MKVQDKKKEINIYINSNEMKGTKPIYKLLLEEFISMGVTGCTIQKSTAGYGTDLNIKYPDEFMNNFWTRESTILLKVIESENKVDEIIKLLDSLLSFGLVTIKDVDYIRYTKPIVTEEDIKLAENV
jgi:PII-like signaling protein